MIDTLGEANAVAIIGLLGGVALGFAARVGRFCTLGAIEDFLYASDGRRLRMWGIAIGIAIVGTHLAMGLGLMDFAQTAYLDRVWNPLATVLGGLMFGYGMALSGNCGYGALARLGGGDLRSFVIVVVMGLSAYVVMSGPLAQLRVMLLSGRNRRDQPTGVFAARRHVWVVRSAHRWSYWCSACGLFRGQPRDAADAFADLLGRCGWHRNRIGLGRHLLGCQYRF